MARGDHTAAIGRRLKQGDRTLTYRDYHISYDPPPIPWRGGDWQFAHDGYDGPGDDRCGFAGDLEEVLARIDELEDDQ